MLANLININSIQVLSFFFIMFLNIILENTEEYVTCTYVTEQNNTGEPITQPITCIHPE